MWYEYLLTFGAGFFMGAFAIALCAMAKCSDCETIARIWRGGKP